MRKHFTCLIISLLVIASCSRNEYYWKGQKLKYSGTVIGELNDKLPEGLSVKRKISRVNDNLFKIVNTIYAEKDLDSVSFSFSFIHAMKPTWLMIPSVSYNGNNWGRGKEPKGFTENGKPRSFEYRRVAVPGATYSESESFTVAMWGTEQKENKDMMFSCSLFPEDSRVTHSLIFPDEELPDSYSGRDRYSSGYKNLASFIKGERQEIVTYIHADRTKENHSSARAFLDNAWNTANKQAFSVPEPKEIWDLGLYYATNSLWQEEPGYKGFGIGLLPDDKGGFSPRKSWKYEIGWCGNNGLFANIFLTDYLKNKNQVSLDKALQCLETWSTNTVLPNGLFITHYDNILNKSERLLDSWNLGVAASSFFEASGLCEKAGRQNSKLKPIAFGIVDFMLNDQEDNGRYGKAWNYKGECVYRDGSIGAFLIVPMIQAYQAAGDKKYLNSAVKACDFYVGELLANGYATAGALDTWCIDCESAMSLLRSSMLLWEVTGEKKYIEYALAASYYIATWQWHYHAAYPPGNDFVKYGYNSFGATAVSVQHHHISSHISGVIPDWIKLSKITGNHVWKERAVALWRNGCQLISDGTLVIHDRVRPKGSQNESFFQSNWSFYADKSRSINDWLVAWPSAYRMDVLRRIGDWNELN